MKYKVGDLVRACWRPIGRPLHGSLDPRHWIGVVISRRHIRRGDPVQHFGDELAYGKIYEVYLTNLQCHRFFEKHLEKL